MHKRLRKERDESGNGMILLCIWPCSLILSRYPPWLETIAKLAILMTTMHGNSQANQSKRMSDPRPELEMVKSSNRYT